jgi:hypothetical protein
MVDLGLLLPDEDAQALDRLPRVLGGDPGAVIGASSISAPRRPFQ